MIGKIKPAEALNLVDQVDYAEGSVTYTIRVHYDRFRLF